MIRLRNCLSRFRRSERGSIPIEGVMGALLLLGWYMVAFEFYDAFRMRSQITKATYTVADLLSRQRDDVGPRYVTGMKKVFDFMTDARVQDQSWMRVTLIECQAVGSDWRSCDGITKPFVVTSSYATKTGVSTHTNTSIRQEVSRIPVMAAGDMATIVETAVHYNPFFGIGERAFAMDGKNFTQIGLNSRLVFSSFVVTRPRGPRVVWNGAK
ncbi:MAG: hypothetical protein R3D78_12955 [Paracoccaceae bacterium]